MKNLFVTIMALLFCYFVGQGQNPLIVKGGSLILIDKDNTLTFEKEKIIIPKIHLYITALLQKGRTDVFKYGKSFFRIGYSIDGNTIHIKSLTLLSGEPPKLYSDQTHYQNKGILNLSIKEDVKGIKDTLLRGQDSTTLAPNLEKIMEGLTAVPVEDSFIFQKQYYRVVYKKEGKDIYITNITKGSFLPPIPCNDIFNTFFKRSDSAYSSIQDYCIPVPKCDHCWFARTEKYKIVYDFGTNNIQPSINYLKLKHRIFYSKTNPMRSWRNYYVTKKKLRPAVNDEIGFDVINYKPGDSISLVYNFESRNTEGAKLFLNSIYNMEMFPAGLKDTTKSANKHSEFIIEKQSIDATNLLCVKSVLTDLIYTYSSHIPAAPKYFKDKIKLDSLIEKMLAISIVTPQNIKAKALEIAAKQPETANEIIAIGETVAKLYEQFISFTTPRFNPIQVENHDFLNFRFEGKGGKLLLKREIQIRAGVKIDFSGGIFYTGLNNRSYLTKDTTLVSPQSGDTLTGKMILRKNEGKFNLGFGMLAHIYPRTGTKVNFGGSFGFILATDFMPRFLVGGSLMFGNKQRFVINGGAAVGQVKRLKTGYYEGINPNDIKFYTDESGEPSTEQVWNINFYVGLTYNFGGFRVGGG